MQSKTSIVAPALKALVENLIDYAGIFPPATVDLGQAVLNYNVYKSSEYAWMLRNLVVDASNIDQIPAPFIANLSVLATADQANVAALETKEVVASVKPVYVEVALTDLHKLEDVKKSGCYAKIRTGGVKAEAIPQPKDVANFINSCSKLQLPFKATAGLHHPIRAERNLTYEQLAPRAVMHGFVNVLLAAAFAWQGQHDIEPILAEEKANAFRFDDEAHWQNKSLTVAQIIDCRKNFMHSIGSCSFDEPVDELKELHWLA